MPLAIRIENLNKSFGMVHALKNVSLDVYDGETLALVGENGAGKSTLMKILTGAYQKDSGKILVGEQEVTISNTIKAKRLGIGQVYQRAELVPELTVAENILLGEKEFSQKGFVSAKWGREKVGMLLRKYDFPIRPEQIVGALSGALCQLVAIAKVLHRNPQVIILDEPTAVLSDKEVKLLFGMIEELKREKKTIIYISHRLEEVFQICERVAVMRDGMMVTTLKNENLTKDALVEYMLGRAIDKTILEKQQNISREVVLELKHVTGKKIKDVSFQLHKGEILGMAGLVNSGRTETARAIYGLDKLISGEVLIEGKVANIRRAKDAVDRGIFLAPEDRRKEAMVLCRSVRENVSLSNLKSICRHRIIQNGWEKRRVYTLCKDLNVKMDSIESPVQNLSGGNQQKIVVAKALTAKPKILIFDEPTQGIDVGAKSEIYAILEKLRNEGLSILVISSEIEELQRVCDRIVVMHDGRLTGEVSGDELSNAQLVLKYMYRSGKNDK
ncbi:MAG: sugar ABC transporter ATP-binding protein [Clostridia bacterium]